MPSPLSGQVNPVTGTAQSLTAGATISCSAFSIKAPASNVNSVFVGAAGVTTSTGHCLDPGDSLDYERGDQLGHPRFQLNPSDFFVVGTAGSDIVSWLASP